MWQQSLFPSNIAWKQMSKYFRIDHTHKENDMYWFLLQCSAIGVLLFHIKITLLSNFPDNIESKTSAGSHYYNNIILWRDYVCESHLSGHSLVFSVSVCHLPAF